MDTSRVEGVTILLRQLQTGDSTAWNRLLELIYPELRRLAGQHLNHERPGHLLQPTALVNEAYLRLIDHHDQNWQNRAHFLGAASQAMRRILIDHARQQLASKRGIRPVNLTLEQVDAEMSVDENPVELLALDEALSRLERQSHRQARIVEMRYFAGLSIPEIATAVGVNPRTIDREWTTARAWLRTQLRP